MIPEFTDLFAQSPDYQIAKADKSIYRSFCSKEPELVSCYDNFDGDYDEEFLVFKKNNQPLGLASIVIRENPNKPAQPKIYARLGLIIVDKKYREIGIGRLLIVCSLLFALRTQRQQIYSISCLAAYAMVEKYLKELSFQEHPRKDGNYWQGTLNLEEVSPEALIGVYLDPLLVWSMAN